MTGSSDGDTDPGGDTDPDRDPDPGRGEAGAPGGVEGDPGTVLLVRHGETEWNRTGRLQGWAPVGLNDRGREQARRAGRLLADRYDVDRAVASDLRRTRETVRELRRALSLGGDGVTFDRAWRERGMGVFQGMTYEAVFEAHPEFDVFSSGVPALRATPENGESLLTVRDRVLGGFRSLVAGLDPGETVAVVTHGGPIGVVLGDLAGLDLPTAIAEYHLDNCGVSEVRVDGDGPAAVRTNVTADPG